MPFSSTAHNVYLLWRIRTKDIETIRRLGHKGNIVISFNPLPDHVHLKSHTRLSTLILSVQLILYSRQ